MKTFKNNKCVKNYWNLYIKWQKKDKIIIPNKKFIFKCTYKLVHMYNKKDNFFLLNACIQLEIFTKISINVIHIFLNKILCVYISIHYKMNSITISVSFFLKVGGHYWIFVHKEKLLKKFLFHFFYYIFLIFRQKFFIILMTCLFIVHIRTNLLN